MERATSYFRSLAASSRALRVAVGRIAQQQHRRQRSGTRCQAPEAPSFRPSQRSTHPGHVPGCQILPALCKNVVCDSYRVHTSPPSARGCCLRPSQHTARRRERENSLGVDQCQFPDQCQSEYNTEFRYTNIWRGSRTRRPKKLHKSSIRPLII